MYHEYPYTTYFHDIDKMCHACHKAGYRLEVVGDYLKLIDGKGNVISNVQISYAEKALTDVDGTPIRAYIVSAAAGESTLVFQHGDDSVTTITVPYATKAKEDVYGVDLTSYLKTVQVSGDKIHFTNGDGTSYELTMPYAIKASKDENGKQIDTYAATLATDGDELVLKDSKNRELARLTVNYALRALADDDGDPIESTYGNDLEDGTTTIRLRAKDGTLLDEITVPYATKALTDTDGNRFLSDYTEKIVVDGDGRRIGVEAHDGTRLATITVPFATLATDATNAIENVQIVGDQLIFTTHGGINYSITVPYALKAQKDDNGNTIKTTYIANVDNDASTGALRFYDALGNIIVTLTPTVTQATRDNLGNVIADYIKAVVADPQSDYVVFTHGDGDTDSITVPYSLRAWKDSLGQPIQNTYITNITIEEDKDEPGKFYLVGWNGDIPKAKIVKIPLKAGGTKIINEFNSTVYDSLKLLSPLTVFNDGNNDRLTLNNSGFAGSLDLTGNNLSLVANNGNVMNSVTLASGAKKVNASWSEETVLGTLCAKYKRLELSNDETLNIGDIVIANSATLRDCCYADLVALNTDGTGKSHFFIDIHGLLTSPLEQSGNSYSDINYISADRQWTFVVADTNTAIDMDGNEYTKYVLIPYSIIPILDDEDRSWSHTGRGLAGNTSDIADIAGKLLYSYGCGNITSGQPVELVDSSGNALTPDDAYLVIGANKEFTEVFKFNSGSNKVAGVKTHENNLTIPTSIYADGSMGLPKSVPLYYDPTTGTYKLTNNVDLTSDSWTWFFVHGQYIS